MKDGHVDSILTAVSTMTGLSASGSMRRRAPRALSRAARVMELDSGELAARVALGESSALTAVVEALTVGETYFFRHPTQFDALVSTVLPSLLERGVAMPRIKSAGCATGEEAWSLAATLAEAGIVGRVRGADLDRAAIETATTGRYRSTSLRSVAVHRIMPHLDRGDGHWVVSSGLRARVDFTVQNLLDRTGDLYDVVFCRNVLIYLDQVAMQRVVDNLVATLAEGGYLFTGPSDPPLWDHPRLRVELMDGGIIYQVLPENQGEPVVPTRPRRKRRTPRRPRPAIRSRRPKQPPRVNTKTPAELYADGQFAACAEATSGVTSEDEAIWHVQALLRADSIKASQACRRALEKYPMAPGLHLLAATIALDAGEFENALDSARRAAYLDRDLALAQFIIGTAAVQLGDEAAAQRAFAMCIRRCTGDRDSPVPYGVGISAGELASAAQIWLSELPSEVAP